MKINLHNKKFIVESNTSNGQVDNTTIFNYEQVDKIISATYSGGNIIQGHLIGIVVDDTYLDFVYHHINDHHELMTGNCKSYPSVNEFGKISIKEFWQWTCKDFSTGESTLIEI